MRSQGKKSRLDILGLRRGGSFARIFPENPYTEAVAICDFEKKRLFDLIKIVAHNIEQEMTKTFSSYYTRTVYQLIIKH